MKITNKIVKEYFLCFIGALIVAAGIYFFKFPNNFSTGGLSGLAIVLNKFVPFLSSSRLSSILNVFMLLIGFLFLGRDCGFKTVFGTVVLSGALMVFEWLFPLTAPLTDEPFLELFYAMGLTSIGSAILFQVDGSTGGTDIVAMILRKHTKMNIGVALMISDILITLSAFLFDVKTGLYSLFGLALKTVVVDSMIENINLCKCFQIITNDSEEISAYIINELHHSCTVIEATGAFTHSHKYVIIAAMRRYQAVRLQKFLKKEHPDTFMMITNSSEVIGKGFRGL